MSPPRAGGEVVGHLGGVALLAAVVHVEGQGDARLQIGGAGGVAVDDLVEGVQRDPWRVGVPAFGDRVTQAGPWVWCGFDAHLRGDESRLLGECAEPVAVVGDPLVNLRLVDECGTVGLGLDDDRQVPGPRVHQDGERSVVRIAGFRQQRGGQQAGQLVAA